MTIGCPECGYIFIPKKENRPPVHNTDRDFAGDGRVRISPDPARSLRGSGRPMTRGQARRVIAGFKRNNFTSHHSINADTIWVIAEWCQLNNKVMYTQPYDFGIMVTCSLKEFKRWGGIDK